MRHKDPQRLSAVLGEVLRMQNLDTKLNEMRLLTAWENRMGKSINAYTKGKYVKDKTLFVHVTSAVLRSDLMMSRRKICEMLNAECGITVISDIVFR
jgi:predicted nucleic acid-binding Zn ribbon protein